MVRPSHPSMTAGTLVASIGLADIIRQILAYGNSPHTLGDENDVSKRYEYYQKLRDWESELPVSIKMGSPNVRLPHTYHLK